MADESVQQVVPTIPNSIYSFGYSRYYTNGIFLDSIQYAQDANNNLYVCSKDFPPLLIQYTPSKTTDNFTITCMMAAPTAVFTGAPNDARHVPFRTPSFNIDNATSFTVVATGANGGVMTTSPATPIFTPDWVGRWIKLTNNGVHSGFYYVDSIIDPNSVTVRRVTGGAHPFPNTNTYGGSSTTDYYELGYWDAISGWPRTVCFVDDRLAFGGNTAFPEYQWFSRSLNYFYFDQRGLESDADFASPLNAVDPFEVVYRDGNKPNAICFQQASKTLVVGTNHFEFIAQAADPNSAINFDNFRKNVETPHGAAYAMAVRLENTTVFLNRSRTTLRELVYNFNEDSFNAADLNILNPDIAKRSISERPSTEYIRAEEDPGFKQIAVETQPDQRIWCLDNNGHLCCLTRERKQEINAWSFHKIAGTYNLSNASEIFYDGKTQSAFVTSISVNQAPDYSWQGIGPENDELWMTVTRGLQETASGTTDPVTYVERMYAHWPYDDIYENWDALSGYKRAPIYMDCAVVADSTTAFSDVGIVSGLPHSHGQSVTVICNGKDLGEFTVNEGVVDFSSALYGVTEWQAIIGLNYTARVIPMCQEMEAQQGTSQGLPRRLHEIVIQFFSTVQAAFGLISEEDGTPVNALEEVTFPDPANQDDPPLLFDGTRRLKMPLGYEERPKVVIESTRPYPCNVSNIITKGVAYE